MAGLFDVEERHAKLTLLGAPLVELKKLIGWEAFRSEIEAAREKARGRKCENGARAKPIDAVLMFKTVVLQQLNNLSDDRIEYQIRDRLSFKRFHKQLAAKGLAAKGGQMVDATFIEVPNSRIAGELDLSSPPQAVALIANAIPGATLKVIAGAPHMLFIEQPQAVAEAILPFLDRKYDKTMA